MFNTYRSELSLSNCGFDHDPAEAIVRSQWQSTSKSNLYLLYRWIVAVFVVSVVIVAICGHVQKGFSLALFFIYLTHWGILINMVVGVFGAILVTVWHFHDDFQGKKKTMTKILTRYSQSDRPPDQLSDKCLTGKTGLKIFTQKT